jgi:hypothetical protein
MVLVCTILPVSTASAQNGAGLFFDITRELINQGIQNDQAKRRHNQQIQYQNEQQQQEAAERRREEQAAAEAQRDYLVQIQTALSSLGFYTLDVDGADGPGTRNAIAAYQRAFDLSGAFGPDDLWALQDHAARGWRSSGEARQAEAGGFPNRSDFEAASRANFTLYAEWQQALGLGIADQASYQAFKTSGFDDYASYQQAERGGFGSAKRFAAAMALGFDTDADYSAFLDSGLADKAAFDAQVKTLAEADAASGLCLDAVEAKDWASALSPCFTAARTRPDDAAATTLLQTVRTQLSAGLAESEKLLAARQTQLSELLASKTAPTAGQVDVATLKGEISDLNDAILLVRLHLQAGGCQEQVSLAHWADAAKLCHVDVSVTHLAGDKRSQADSLVAMLGDNFAAATAAAKSEQELAAAEAARLALARVSDEARLLTADVEDYSARGNSFAQGLDLARTLAALRVALNGNEALLIEKQVTALTAILNADSNFVADQQAKLAAQQQTQKTAVFEARRQAELLNAFLQAYISANVTSEHATALLALQDELAGALSDGNAQKITAAQAQGRGLIETIGLSADLDRFAANYLAPSVSAEALQAQDAAAATTDAAFATAVTQSQALIASIDAFVAGGETFADPIAVARSLKRLKTALGSTDLPILQQSQGALADLVNADATFTATAQSKAASTDSALTNAVAGAKEDLTALNTFLLDYIAKNLTSDSVMPVLDLQSTVEEALAGPVSANLVRVKELAQGQIETLGLGDALVAYRSQEAARGLQPDTPAAENGLAITMANAALLEGEAGDLLVLRNASATAPHLTRDLVGNLMVDGGVATACWPHPVQPSAIGLLLVRQQLAAMGVSRLQWSQCDADMANSADLIVLERGAFLATPPSQALPLVGAFEDGRFVELLSIKAADAAAETARFTAQAADLRQRLDNGTAEGFGMLALTGGGQGLCPVVTDIAPHANLLAARANEIAFFLPNARLAASVTPEQAFVAAQRGTCAALYGDAKVLATLAAAMQRDQIGFDILPIWIEANAVTVETTRLAEISARQRGEQAAQQQADAADAALDAAKRSALTSEQQQAQRKLRDQYGEEAAGAGKTLADAVRGLVANGRSDIVQQLFPNFDKTIRAAFDDQWTITGVDDALVDYGTGLWQGRKVKAVLVKIEVARENSVLGVYANDCVMLGYLVDEEFRMQRDPVEAGCADKQALLAWAGPRGFETLWNSPAILQ